MKLIDKVCEELGVNIGEVWRGDDGFLYSIRADGLVETFDADGGYLYANTRHWEDILTGLLKPRWKPKEGELYYVPKIHPDEVFRYDPFTWENTRFDEWHYENNTAFKDKLEAIECANKMMEAIQK